MLGLPPDAANLVLWRIPYHCLCFLLVVAIVCCCLFLRSCPCPISSFLSNGAIRNDRSRSLAWMEEQCRHCCVLQPHFYLAKNNLTPFLLLTLIPVKMLRADANCHSVELVISFASLFPHCSTVLFLLGIAVEAGPRWVARLASCHRTHHPLRLLWKLPCWTEGESRWCLILSTQGLVSRLLEKRLARCNRM